MSTGTSNECALHDDVLVLGERPRQGPTPIIEAEEATGVEADGPFVGLIPGGQCELADLLGGPVGRFFSQASVRFGLGHLDERPYLVERELSLGQGLGDLGERREPGRGCHPLASGGGGHPAPLHEPRHHGGGAVDSPRMPFVEFCHCSEELALVRRDCSVMLGDARDQGLGSPRHGIGTRSVPEESGCHADVERSPSDAGCVN